MRIKACAAVLPLSWLLTAAASPAGAQAKEEVQADRSVHPERDSEIVVSGALQSNRIDALSGVAILQGNALDAVLRPSIGETLAHTPGASATSFGPNASRPVLRGLQGERVRVLTNGIGSIDVSNTSADHASAVNPLLAERIEVLRGPQSLLYGSAAIGGVVNVIDRRIPTSVPGEPVHLDVLAAYGSAANERSISAAADAPLGGGWVAHADGSFSKSEDLRIGGYALTPQLRAEAADSSLLPTDPASDIDFAANAAVRGKLPNTASRTWNVGGGISRVGDRATFGAAYSHYDSLYGVPIRFATRPGQAQEGPRLQLQQDRIDGLVQIMPDGGPIEKASLRAAYADYTHAELEDDGSVGTRFFNQGLEARLELTQSQRGAWKGASGLQFVRRKFNVIGEEAFLPRNASSQIGLFTVQQIETGPFKVEAGARYEHSRLKAEPDSGQSQFVSGERSFDTVSASLGALYRFAPGWKFGVNVSRTARAPAAEELFANGPHAGTEAFEIGNPGLKPERAWSAEAVLRSGGKGYTIEASVYRSWFSDYIFEARTGALEEGLPVYEVRQAGARYFGFEVQGTLDMARFGDWKLTGDALADYVHADITGAGPAPRIPPFRVLAGLGLKSAKIDLRAAVERAAAQTRVAPFETPTPGYTLVNAEIGWRPWGEARPLSLIVSANNIFNVNARRHASFLKDYAPLAGRDFRVSARLEL